MTRLGVALVALALAVVSCHPEQKHSKHDDDDDDDARTTSAARASGAASGSGSAMPSAAPEAPVHLARASRRVVCDGAKDEIEIVAYLTRGTPQLDAFAARLQALLEAYKAARFERDDGTAAAARFSFRFVDPKTPELQQEATALGIKQQAMSEASGVSVLVTQAFSGMAVRYGDTKDVISYWPPDLKSGLELFITQKLREVRDRAEGVVRRIGVIANKDETKLETPYAFSPPMSLASIFAAYFPGYHFVPVDLHHGDNVIDATLPAVIVTQPGEKYSEKELRRLDEFVMRGDKVVALYASAVNVKKGDPMMTSGLELHGIDKLLRGYGVEMHADAVLDFEGALTYQAQTITGPVSAISPPLLSLSEPFVDPRTPLFRTTPVSFPGASSLRLDASAQPSAKLQSVAHTHGRSTLETRNGLSLMLSPSWIPSGPMDERVIAAVLDGKIRSAFDAAVESKSASRVLVVSSSQFFVNPFTWADNPTAPQPQLVTLATQYAQTFWLSTLSSFKMTLDWMTMSTDDARELTETL